MSQLTKPTGHLQVKGERGSRRWFALWRDADGRHQRLLGPAHVKDSGRKTQRGAIIWRSADGQKPTPSHLTPEEAAAALRAILEAAPREPAATEFALAGPGATATFGDAVAEWLAYVEHEKQRKPSTVRDYRNVARHDLLPRFGAETPLRRVVRGRVVGDTFSIDDVERFRRDLLAREDLSSRTAQKVMTLCSSVFKLAKRRKMIDANPCVDAERISVRASDDFNILSPIDFEAVVRACTGPREVAVVSVAFYAGLRLGEIRELRRGDVDWAKRMIYVRANASAGQRSTTKGGRVRSVPLVDELARRLETLSRRRHWTDADDYVFATDRGARIADKDVRSLFYDSLDGAGFANLRGDVDKHGDPQKPIVFHDLRHSYCSWAVDVWPVPDVRAFAGHRDISTTMKCVHRTAKATHATMADEALRRMLASAGDAVGLTAAHADAR
ncbi:MAG TPA: tyrosine-type recombinase/integrase [Baekduia sp.]|uniref:tyrosine-type recombinase/integrase n=1 Tax=Baekduia sp. TaxID=2600305 RepID=UPI002CE5AAD0|nr:tyrosine-type recombinase/integrase [Baekduia sp.]HMJ35385.1 tyrosine-type recombinase/integrase [Baekduia sp.]